MKQFHYEVEAKLSHIDFIVELHMLLHKKVKLLQVSEENVQRLYKTVNNLTTVKQFMVDRADALETFTAATNEKMKSGDLLAKTAFNLIRKEVVVANDNVKDVMRASLEEYSDTYIEIMENDGEQLLEFLPKPATLIGMLEVTYHYSLKAVPESVELNLDMFTKAS